MPKNPDLVGDDTPRGEGADGLSRRSFVARSAAGLAALTLPGALGTRAARAALREVEASNILRVGFIGTMSGLTPYTYAGYYGFFNVSGVFPSLVGLDARTGRGMPQLAERWAASKDRKTWTFYLKRGGWSDGRPITAHDVEFTWRNAPKVSTQQETFASNYKSFKALDDRTFRVVLKSDDASYPFVYAALYMWVVPRHIWGPWLKSKDTLAEGDKRFPIVGGGPYYIERRLGNQGALYAANRHYFGGRPKTSRLGLRMYGTADIALLALKNNEIDIIPNFFGNLQPSTLGGSLGFFSQPGVSTDFIYVSCDPAKQKHPELLKPEVRNAISLAIDRKQIAQSAYNGFALPMGKIITPAFKQWAVAGLKPDPHDAARANAILDGLGYRRGPDGIRSAGGKRMSYDFPFVNYVPPQEVQVIQSGLRAIGIDINPKPLDYAAFINILYGWNYDLLLFPTYLGYIDVTNAFYPVISKTVPGGESNSCGYSNRTLDELYLRQKATPDLAARKKIFATMEGILRRDKPIIPLVLTSTLSVYRKNVRGLVPSPGGTPSYEDPFDWLNIQVA